MSTQTTQFAEKSAEELQKLGAEELAGYYNELNTHKRQQIEAQISAKADKADIEALKQELMASQTSQLKALNDALKQHGIAIKQLASGRKTDNGAQPKSFRQVLKGQLQEHKAKLEALKNAKGKYEAEANSFHLDVKVPGTMTFTSNVSGGNIPVEDRIEGLNIIPSRVVRLLAEMNQRSTTSNVVSWVYQANRDGDAGQTAEGTTKSQYDFDLIVANEAVKKTTAFIKVSDEMLDDIDWLVGELESDLLRQLFKKVEEGAYEGDGTGANLNGIRTVASAFAAGTFALSVDNANIVDVLTVAANQIQVAQEGMAIPNAIFMHPDDVTSLMLEKITATDKRYVERLVQVGESLLLNGSIPIIPTTLVTVDEYLIGDFTKAMLVTRSGVSLEMGLDADDFTKNLRTIRAEWRGLSLVKNNDRSAFVAGVFSTDITALETV